MKISRKIEATILGWTKNLPLSFDKMSVEKSREAYYSIGKYLGGKKEQMCTEDVLVNLSDRNIAVRLYKPNEMIIENGESPLLLYIHGGGWVAGSIDTHDKVCRHIAAASNVMVASVEYRLAPENPLPACSEDIIEVLKYIYAEGRKWGINPNKLAIGGDSAGGSLSAVGAIAARNENIPLKAQVLIYPSTDNRDSDLYPSRIKNNKFPPMNKSMFYFFRGYFIIDEKQALDWRVSPLLVDSLEGVAPAYIAIGGADMLHDEGIAFAERLKNNGVPVILNDIPGMIHAFIEMYGVLPSARSTIKKIAAFLHQQFDI